MPKNMQGRVRGARTILRVRQIIVSQKTHLSVEPSELEQDLLVPRVRLVVECPAVFEQQHKHGQWDPDDVEQHEGHTNDGHCGMLPHVALDRPVGLQELLAFDAVDPSTIEGREKPRGKTRVC